MKRLIKRLLRNSGYQIVKVVENVNRFSPDQELFNQNDYKTIEDEFFEIYDLCKEYTMTSIDKLYALYLSVKYIIENSIPGDFVECGVWKGGSAMMMAYLLKKLNATERRIFLYDTFNGMTAPHEKDVHISSGLTANQISDRDYQGHHSEWCNSQLNEVRDNLKKTGFPFTQIIFIEGRVEDKLPAFIPDHISLLRLDTDFYESTLHELNHLYPLLMKNGVLIIDDYGFWEGQKKAIDEYFTSNNIHLLLNRINYSGRIAIKN